MRQWDETTSMVVSFQSSLPNISHYMVSYGHVPTCSWNLLLYRLRSADRNLECGFPVWVTLTNHLWVILECDFYAPAYFFLKYKACPYFKIPQGLSTKEVFGPGCQGSLDFFAEGFYFVHNLHNPVWFQNLNRAALVISPSVSCSLLLSKNVSWEVSEHHVRNTKIFRSPFHSSFATDKLTGNIKQHLPHPCSPQWYYQCWKSRDIGCCSRNDLVSKPAS